MEKENIGSGKSRKSYGFAICWAGVKRYHMWRTAMNINGSFIYKTRNVNDKKFLYTWYDDEKEWQKDYVGDEEMNDSVYIDPDSEKSKCIPFYEALTAFLNAREEQVKGLNGQYTYKFNETKPYGIEVREIIKLRDGREEIAGPIFYLKSDQFGFSAPKNGGKYPYDIYINRSKDKESAKEKVADWVYYSRSLGGSFLWPMEPDGRGGWFENPSINTARGGANPFNKKGEYQGGGYDRYWIEDRVDLTLFEIKRVLDYISTTNLESSILWNCCLPETNLMKWLKHFGTYEKYVEYFCFSPFVDTEKGYVPIDIVESNIEEQMKEILGDEKDIVNKRKEKSIFHPEMSVEKLEKMFNNVIKMIQERTELMKETFIFNIR